jgi:hypothetical protein
MASVYRKVPEFEKKIKNLCFFLIEPIFDPDLTKGFFLCLTYKKDFRKTMCG